MIEEQTLQNQEQFISNSPKYQWEDWCFYCKGGGLANCCSKCSKTFHSECQKKIKKLLPKSHKEVLSDEWVCPCCISQEICPVCNKAVDDISNDKNVKFFCTLCCRKVHSKCYSYSIEVSSQSSQIETPLVCFQCFKSSGIKYIKQRKILQKNTYFLAEPFFASHLHSGWITFLQFCKITQEMTKKIPAQNILKHTEITPPKLQDIYMIKPDLQRLIDWKQYISESRLNKQRIKIYIKWQKSSNQQYSWQDEFTLRHHNLLDDKRIQIYLLRKWLNQNIITLQIAREKAKLLYSETNSENIFGNYFNYFSKYKFGFDLISNHNQIISLVSNLYNTFNSNLYSKLFPINRILFVTNTPQVWNKSLKTYIPFIRLFEADVCQQKFNAQLEMEFPDSQSEPMFDILILREENKKYLSSKQLKDLKFDLVILCTSQCYDTHKQILQKYSQSLKLILYRNISDIQKLIPQSLQKQAKAMIQLFPTINLSNQITIQNQTTDKTISNNKVMQVQMQKNHLHSIDYSVQQSAKQCLINNSNNMIPKNLNQKSKKKNKIIQPLNLLQRLHFLRFVLQFGLEFATVEILYQKLLSFEPQKQIFNKSESILKSTKSHLEQFLSRLVSNKYSEQYFESWKCSDIIKRIAALSILRKAYEHYKQQPWRLPLQPSFAFANKGNQHLYSENWKSEDDIRLLELILEYGYNNWELICQNFCVNSRNGYEYLRIAIWPSLQKNNVWKTNIQACIKRRSNMLMDNEQLERFIQLN